MQPTGPDHREPDHGEPDHREPDHGEPSAVRNHAVGINTVIAWSDPEELSSRARTNSVLVFTYRGNLPFSFNHRGAKDTFGHPEVMNLEKSQKSADSGVSGLKKRPIGGDPHSKLAVTKSPETRCESRGLNAAIPGGERGIRSPPEIASPSTRKR